MGVGGRGGGLQSQGLRGAPEKGQQVEVGGFR